MESESKKKNLFRHVDENKARNNFLFDFVINHNKFDEKWGELCVNNPSLISYRNPLLPVKYEYESFGRSTYEVDGSVPIPKGRVVSITLKDEQDLGETEAEEDLDSEILSGAISTSNGVPLADNNDDSDDNASLFDFETNGALSGELFEELMLLPFCVTQLPQQCEEVKFVSAYFGVNKDELDQASKRLKTRAGKTRTNCKAMDYLDVEPCDVVYWIYSTIGLWINSNLQKGLLSVQNKQQIEPLFESYNTGESIISCNTYALRNVNNSLNFVLTHVASGVAQLLSNPEGFAQFYGLKKEGPVRINLEAVRNLAKTILKDRFIIQCCTPREPELISVDGVKTLSPSDPILKAIPTLPLNGVRTFPAGNGIPNSEKYISGGQVIKISMVEGLQELVKRI